MKDLVELTKASVVKMDPDVLITQYKSDTKILEDDAREIDNAHVTMAQGGDMFVIVDLSAGGTKIDKTAEDYFSRKSKMMPFIKAIAVVKDHKASFLSRFLTKRSIFPQKEFTNTGAAQAWFQTLRN